MATCIYCRPAGQYDDGARECNICGRQRRIPTEALYQRHAIQNIEDENQAQAERDRQGVDKYGQPVIRER